MGVERPATVAMGAVHVLEVPFFDCGPVLGLALEELGTMLGAVVLLFA
jgi:hypothetical protein